ncbi:hypothetical protein SARC_16622, partial [Sphaeroforma arctica JP610]
EMGKSHASHSENAKEFGEGSEELLSSADDTDEDDTDNEGLNGDNDQMALERRNSDAGAYALLATL